MFAIVVLVETGEFLPPAAEMDVVEANLVEGIAADAAEVDERENGAAFADGPDDNNWGGVAGARFGGG